MTDARTIIDALGLEPHPEGGYYRRTYRHAEGPENRGHMTAIYYLLEGGEFSRWHRTDGDEIYHWYAGAPLTIETAAGDGSAKTAHRLGNDFTAGERPQILIPAGVWQRSNAEGDWTLVGATVAPGFSFDGFEMPEKGWVPEGA